MTSLWFVYIDYTTEHVMRPYYVGKGDEHRFINLVRNGHHERTARKHGLERRLALVTDNEAYAFETEKALIARLKTRRGIPGHWGTNLTDGGEGASNPSPEVRKKRGLSVKKANTPVLRAKKSRAMQKKWLEPGYRERRRESMVVTWSDLERRDRQSVVSKKAWSDPVLREKQSQTLKAACSLPTEFDRKSKASKKVWSDEGLLARRRKKIVQLDLEGNMIAMHASATFASRAIGMTARCYIIACCKGRRSQAHGFVWRYA